MANHYHFVLQTPEPNLVAGMKWFQNTYTRRLNCRHRLWGHVFGGRYKAIVVEAANNPASSKGANEYLALLLDYVHLNPLRAGLVNPKRGKGLLDYAWSSLSQGYALAPGGRPSWLETKTGFQLAGKKDSPAGRRAYVQRLEEAGLSGQQQLSETQTLNSTLQRGWYWGSRAFRDRMLRLLAQKRRKANQNYRYSPQARQQGEAWAGELVADGLKVFGLKAADLKSCPGSMPAKVVIAAALKERTTVSQKWIAERLWMKSAGNVCQQVRRLGSGEISASKEQQAWLKSVRNR